MAFRDIASAGDKVLFSALGDIVTRTPAGGGDAEDIEAFFDNLYYASDTDPRAPATGTRPIIHIRDADVPGAARGDIYAFNGVTYKAVTLEPTGDGVTVCELERI